MREGTLCVLVFLGIKSRKLERSLDLRNGLFVSK